MEIKFSKKERKLQNQLFVFLFYSIIIFFIGVYSHRSGMLYDIKNNFIALISIPNKISNIMTGNLVDRINIDIKFEDYEKISDKRKHALRIGRLFSNSNDFVPANIRYRDKIKKVKIRLKGDEIDHLKSLNNWSFRVKVSGEDELFGLKKFSLHKPFTRNYVYEWIYHKALKRENIISLRYFFVNLSINGKDLGIYAIEEFFHKILIENNRRREGPILKISEDLFWEENVLSKNNKYVLEEDPYIRSNIDVFNTSAVLGDSVLEKQFSIARTMLQRYKRNEISIEQVFDLELFSKYLAISELLKSQHGNIWGNERFYYNPITSKIEPIGFDANAGTEESSILSGNYKLYNRAFDNNTFAKMFVKHLERLSNKTFLDSLFNEIDNDLIYNIKILKGESIFHLIRKFFINNKNISNQFLILDSR